jgi:hypothetical protein
LRETEVARKGQTGDEPQTAPCQVTHKSNIGLH